MLEPEHGPIMQVEHTHTRCWVCVLSCLLLACQYVGSLYVWRSSLPRDHPRMIKRRCASVLLVSALSPAVHSTENVHTLQCALYNHHPSSRESNHHISQGGQRSVKLKGIQ
uniref:Uncharacterized protein n=1 Tax=Sander lucioperca TaxID=283035 RepID=A0A8C9X5B9_SANLU